MTQTMPEAEFPRSKQSANGTQRAFSVEARFSAKGYQKFGDQIFTNEWKKVSFVECPFGVPTSHRYEFAAPYFGLFSYQSAQALRWWFHAALEAEHHDSCMETRLIEHVVKYSLEEEAIAEHLKLGNSDDLDRSLQTRMPPDWKHNG